MTDQVPHGKELELGETPQSVGGANAEGTSDKFARGDHVHQGATQDTKLSHTEKWQIFTAGADASWQTKDLSGYSVPANAICFILAVNKAAGNEKEVGVRQVGSSLERKVDLHEAEAGGITPVLFTVKADSLSRVQVYAETDADVDFYLMSYLS